MVSTILTPTPLQKQDKKPVKKPKDAVLACAVMARDWNTNVPVGQTRRAFAETIIHNTAAANSNIAAVRSQIRLSRIVSAFA